MERNGALNVTASEFKSYQNRIPGFTTQVVFKNGTSSIEQGLLTFNELLNHSAFSLTVDKLCYVGKNIWCFNERSELFLHSPTTEKVFSY